MNAPVTGYRCATKWIGNEARRQCCSRCFRGCHTSRRIITGMRNSIFVRETIYIVPFHVIRNTYSWSRKKKKKEKK